MKQLFHSDSEEDYDFNGEGDRGTLELKKSFKGDSRFKLTEAFHAESTDVTQLSSKMKNALSAKEISQLQRSKPSDIEDQFEEEKNRLLHILATVVPQAQVFGGGGVVSKQKKQENGKESKYQGLIQERFDPTKQPLKKPKKEEKKKKKEKIKMPPITFEKYVKIAQDWNENPEPENENLAGLFSNTLDLLEKPFKTQETRKEKKGKEVLEKPKKMKKKKIKREEKKEQKAEGQGSSEFERRMLNLIAKFKNK